MVFQELLAGAKSSPGERQENGRPLEGHAGAGSAGSSESTGNGGASVRSTIIVEEAFSWGASYGEQ